MGHWVSVLSPVLLITDPRNCHAHQFLQTGSRSFTSGTTTPFWAVRFCRSVTSPSWGKGRFTTSSVRPRTDPRSGFGAATRDLARHYAGAAINETAVPTANGRHPGAPLAAAA